MENYQNTLSIISKIHSLSSSFLKKELENQGLAELVSSHGNILFQLSVNEKLSMGEIASRIHRDKSTTTVLVKKLEKEGYVERTKNQEDNRSFFLQLTEKGMQYTKATSEISGKLVSKAYENFSEEEKNTAYALLSRICDNFMIG